MQRLMQRQSKPAQPSASTAPNPSAAAMRAMKELEKILQDEHFTTYFGTVLKYHEEDVSLPWVAVIFGPQDSPFEGGRFRIEISFPTGYPYDAPRIRFLTPVYHPNIQMGGDGYICDFDMSLGQNSISYSPITTIKYLMLVIWLLLISPNPRMTVNYHVGKLYLQDKNKFDSVARVFTEKYAVEAKQPKTAAGVNHSQQQQRQDVVPLKNRGVSIHFLREFMKECSSTPTSPTADIPTSEIVSRFIKPRTLERKCRYTELIAPELVQAPTVFVSHSWFASFGKLVQCLDQKCKEDGQEHSYWIDIFAINQHQSGLMLEDLSQLHEAISETKHTLLILDPHSIALTRAWCMYEIFKSAQNYCVLSVADMRTLDSSSSGSGSGNSSSSSNKDKRKASHVKIQDCQATVTSDKEMILKEIAGTVGFEEVNTFLKNSLEMLANGAGNGIFYDPARAQAIS